MQNKGPYYLTTAIAYTSGKPHIGNNYEIVLADSIARFKRKEGYDVFFQTGTDEHGQKIELKAQDAGVTPKEYVDKVAGVIRELCDLLNISYDKFIRTTDADHEKAVQRIFTKLYEQGDIYKSTYEGKYCVPCESFYTESQLVDGKCFYFFLYRLIPSKSLLPSIRIVIEIRVECFKKNKRRNFM